jgi:hypothetical protein
MARAIEGWLIDPKFSSWESGVVVVIGMEAC